TLSEAGGSQSVRPFAREVRSRERVHDFGVSVLDADEEADVGSCVRVAVEQPASGALSMLGSKLSRACDRGSVRRVHGLISLGPSPGLVAASAGALQLSAKILART